MRTAELATRLAIDALRGSQRGSILRSWKGSDVEFQRADLRTSSRYTVDAETLERGVAHFAATTCRVCGSH